MTFLIISNIYFYFPEIKREIASRILQFVLRNGRKDLFLTLSKNKKYCIITIEGKNIYVPYNKKLITSSPKYIACFEDETFEKIKNRKGFPLVLTPNDLGASHILVIEGDTETMIEGNQRCVDVLKND